MDKEVWKWGVNLPELGHNAAVRSVQLDGDVWYSGADVCAILNLANTGQAYSRLDPDEKRHIDRSIIGDDSISPQRTVVFVNEPGLYNLIMTSRTEAAQAFQRWVRHTLLPAVRRRLAAQLDAITPAAHAGEALLLAAGTVDMAEAAKIITSATGANFGTTTLRRFLLGEPIPGFEPVAEKWLYLRGTGRAVPYQWLVDHGYMMVGADVNDGRIGTSLRFTGIGLAAALRLVTAARKQDS